MPNTEAVVRTAVVEDVPNLCRFGRAHLPPHYAPLIGAAAAEAQVRLWWSEEHLSSAVTAGLIVVAESDGALVGVAQRGGPDGEPILFKLYLDPAHRSQGLGPRLIEAVIARLPNGTDRILVEHFAANEPAGAFYEREGLTVDHVDASGSEDARLHVVWRSKDLRGCRAAPAPARSPGTAP